MPFKGVPAQHVGVGQARRSADLNEFANGFRRLNRTDQIGQHITGRDRLRFGVEPGRTNENRLALGEIADHLEQCRAGADDHPRAKLRHRHFALPKDISCFVPRAQVGRKIRGRVNQFTEVNDAVDIRFAGGMYEKPRHLHVMPGIDLASLHSVDEIVCDGHILHCGLEDIRR